MRVLKTEDFTEIMTRPLSYRAKFLTLTQKHCIITYENGYMEWLFRYDPHQQDDERKPLHFDKEYNLPERGNITQFVYNHILTEILIGLENSSLLILPMAAESNIVINIILF